MLINDISSVIEHKFGLDGKLDQLKIISGDRIYDMTRELGMLYVDVWVREGFGGYVFKKRYDRFDNNDRAIYKKLESLFNEIEPAPVDTETSVKKRKHQKQQ